MQSKKTHSKIHTTAAIQERLSEMLAQALVEMEFLKGLAQNWPLMATALFCLWWFAKYIAHPLTTRHIAFVDGIEERDRERIKMDIEHATTLSAVKKETEETNSRLSSLDKNWKRSTTRE